ncbi:MAG: ATP-binding protein [Candidatus Omnitrophica bacterium]|nr:ATP-binding protein [Candidatus Omnitrophota bacterium]
MITRQIQENIEKHLFKGKAIILYGARQTGKTTLVSMIKEKHKNSLYLNCDEIDIREKLTKKTSTELATLIGNKKLVVIDEAQRVVDIGLTIKILVDTMKDTQIIATGSSSFELSDKIKEPLTGRVYEFHLYPFSFNELNSLYQKHELERIVEQRMVYGMYPEVVLSQEKEILLQLADSYLYKDILAYQNIKSHDILIKLLQAISLQIGNEVSYNELSSTVGIDKKTVENYINILEKAFIVFRLNPFSRNLRNELKKLRKIYFYDLGIRNALINNFNPLGIRQDTGALFENFVIAERIKRNSNLRLRKNFYFWRTHQQKEIDYIEEEAGILKGYEIKFSKTKFKAPQEFLKAYKDSSVELVNKSNCLEFIT